MLEDMKNRQSKMVDLQSAMQSGDIKSGYVIPYIQWYFSF